jgi:hypothetical protein
LCGRVPHLRGRSRRRALANAMQSPPVPNRPRNNMPGRSGSAHLGVPGCGTRRLVERGREPCLFFSTFLARRKTQSLVAARVTVLSSYTRLYRAIPFCQFLSFLVTEMGPVGGPTGRFVIVRSRLYRPPSRGAAYCRRIRRPAGVIQISSKLQGPQRPGEEKNEPSIYKGQSARKTLNESIMRHAFQARNQKPCKDLWPNIKVSQLPGIIF